jgi:hypothetical protein
MSVMITAILAILVLVIALLLWAQEIERDRRLLCEIVPKLLYTRRTWKLRTRRTWKLRITNESNSIRTLGEVVVSGRIATSIHAEQAKVNVGSIMLATGQRVEFDLEPPLTELLEKLGRSSQGFDLEPPPTELLEKLGRSGQGDAAIVLDVTMDVHSLVKSKKRKRTVHFIALCDHRYLVKVLTKPAPDFGPIITCIPVKAFRASR